MADGMYKKPRTIEEFKAFCEQHDIPAEKMRFFIGVDHREPKAYGVYKDENGDFVLYKNKTDGTRAVRYKGPYEDIAINELYEKMKAEVEKRKGNTRAFEEASYDETSAERSSYSESGHVNDDGLWHDPGEDSSAGFREAGGRITKPGCTRFFAWFTAIIVGSSLLMVVFDKSPKRGYYNYDNTDYYYDSGYWYDYDYDSGEWDPAYEIDPYLEENYDDYYVQDWYDESSDYSDFSDSDYYDESYYSDDDDYDWDSDYDYDDYDYGDSDWDSDW